MAVLMMAPWEDVPSSVLPRMTVTHEMVERMREESNHKERQKIVVVLKEHQKSFTLKFIHA